ncbi:MAG: HNH endonuclease [Tannerella sp.]|jgi:hypothetical protein|nr:HNH endonuclease [Tannerella sp.]
MFNVIRPQPGPDCSKDYRTEETVKALKTMFYGKCYLCEDEVRDPVVEHFIAHKGNDSLKYDWNNLFYTCPRCNSIKETNIDNKNLAIHDCCDASTDVSRAVKCLCPSVPNHDVVVKAQDISDKTGNTAVLLNRCYNEDNTGIRGISKEALHEKLFGCYCKFIDDRRVLKSRDTLQSEKDKALEHLKKMTEPSYPFSVFWEWHIWSDAFLRLYLNVN